MLKNPEKKGMPEMARQEMKKVAAVIGMKAFKPPILRMSCSSCMPWMTEPEPRNKQALKKAWVMRWKMAATKAPDAPRPGT